MEEPYVFEQDYDEHYISVRDAMVELLKQTYWGVCYPLYDRSAKIVCYNCYKPKDRQNDTCTKCQAAPLYNLDSAFKKAGL